MPPRASWTGYLKVSLVTIPILLGNNKPNLSGFYNSPAGNPYKRYG